MTTETAHANPWAPVEVRGSHLRLALKLCLPVGAAADFWPLGPSDQPAPRWAEPAHGPCDCLTMPAWADGLIRLSRVSVVSERAIEAALLRCLGDLASAQRVADASGPDEITALVSEWARRA